MLPTTARVHKTDPLPRHYQVRQILVEMIASGLWQPGDKIPAETDLARSLGVSKMTVNKAILALTAEGVLYREVGRGTFIAEAPIGSATATISQTGMQQKWSQGAAVPRICSRLSPSPRRNWSRTTSTCAPCCSPCAAAPARWKSGWCCDMCGAPTIWRVIARAEPTAGC